MKNAKELLSEATSKGYIMLPKHLMEIFLLHKKSQATELEAFLILLSRTNYKDETFRVKEKTMLCHRGESMRSLESWGQLFGWKKGKTTYFFNKLKRMGLIESIPNEVTTHLRIKEYEVWTGNEWRKPVPKEQGQHRPCPEGVEKATGYGKAACHQPDRNLLCQPQEYKLLQASSYVSGRQGL